VKAGFMDIMSIQCVSSLRCGVHMASTALAVLSATMALLLLVQLAAAGGVGHPSNECLSVRHLTSSTNSEISEAEFTKMLAKKLQIRVWP
jgi:hypothetical protein